MDHDKQSVVLYMNPCLSHLGEVYFVCHHNMGGVLGHQCHLCECVSLQGTTRANTCIQAHLEMFPCHQTMTKYTPIGPSTVIPNPPTVEDHMSDVECSKVQDKAHVPGRRNRRPRSELILVYQCTTYNKKYASSVALYQHKKNSHNQSLVIGSGRLSDATGTVDISCDVEGSQDPSKCTRKRKLKLIESFPVQCAA